MDNIVEYSRYKDPQVRALVWSLISPGLVVGSEEGDFSACVSQDWCRQIYEQLRFYFKQLDRDSSPLIDYLQQQNSWRLGIRFEAYWTFILEQLKQRGELLHYASHLQIQDQIKQTKGEIDFIYLDKQQQLNHLEIAVKFYLLKPDEFGYERLVGPNGGDWYERKLLHLFKKQLPLSATEDAKEKIAQTFDLTPEQACCQRHGIMKGMIFFPVTGEGELNDHEKQSINPLCLTGLWATLDNWHLADPGQLGRWVVLEKLNWIVPQIYYSVDDKMYTGKEMAYKLKIHFHATRRSILIARLEYDEERRLWLEKQRLMVVDKYGPVFKRLSRTGQVEISNPSLENKPEQVEQYE